MSEAFAAVLSFLWSQGYQYGFAETDARRISGRDISSRNSGSNYAEAKRTVTLARSTKRSMWFNTVTGKSEVE
jgi:hypothetical protein